MSEAPLGVALATSERVSRLCAIGVGWRVAKEISERLKQASLYLLKRSRYAEWMMLSRDRC